MNTLKKIYCRSYQYLFKLAIPLLPYRQPKILNSMDEISNVIKENNCSHPLIVTGKSSVRLKLVENLENTLHNAELDCSVFSDTVPNPTTDNVNQAVKIYKENNCDCIIGLGGGSAMDCAKAVGAQIVLPNKPLSRMKGVLKIRKKLPLLIAIPTTAGTGSETTVASVIVDSQTRHKYAISDFCLIPDYAVLDEKLTVTLPSKLTATTGMDAFTHAIEAYIGKSCTNETKKLSEEAIKLIFENLPIAYNEPNNLQARKNMLIASYKAGCAFTVSYVGYVHAIAHSLGGKYDIGHGLANAVILPYVLNSYGDTITNKLAKLSHICNFCSETTSNKKAAKIFLEKLTQLERQLNIPTHIAELKQEDIETLAKQADKEANPLYPVPLLMDNKELKKIYKQLLTIKE